MTIISEISEILFIRYVSILSPFFKRSHMIEKRKVRFLFYFTILNHFPLIYQHTSMAIIMIRMCAHTRTNSTTAFQPDASQIGFISRKLQKADCRDLVGIPIYVIRPQINDDDLSDQQAACLLTLIETCWNHGRMGRQNLHSIVS